MTMSQNARFNKAHKNGWFSYKVAGSAGAVMIDRRQLRADFPFDNPPATLDEALTFLNEPGAEATARDAEKVAKAKAREEARAAKAAAAIEKANARIAKLQEQAQKAAERAAAAAAKAGTVSE
jgi:hypothetical protein